MSDRTSQIIRKLSRVNTYVVVVVFFLFITFVVGDSNLYVHLVNEEAGKVIIFLILNDYTFRQPETFFHLPIYLKGLPCYKNFSHHFPIWTIPVHNW